MLPLPIPQEYNDTWAPRQPLDIHGATWTYKLLGREKLRQESSCKNGTRAATLVHMGKRKGQPPGGSGGGKQPQRKGVPLHIWIDPVLSAAIAAYMDSMPVKPTLTAAVSAALKDFLRRNGFWPPPAPSP
jgi:hypothetical protein